MSDNTRLNAGSGGDLIAADDINSVKFQRVKVGWGTDGSYNEVAATTGGTPTDGSGQGRLPTSSIETDGTYNKTPGKLINFGPLTIPASSSPNSGILGTYSGLGWYTDIVFEAECTNVAPTGVTPYMSLYIQDSLDGNNWMDVCQVGFYNATGRKRAYVAGKIQPTAANVVYGSNGLCYGNPGSDGAKQGPWSDLIRVSWYSANDQNSASGFRISSINAIFKV